MPAFNEGHHIRANLRETVKLFDKVKCDYEILVVDDGSTDNTREQVALAAREDQRIKCIALGRNYGKGKALQTGFSHSRGDYIVFLDSDLDLPPRQLIRLFKVMRDEAADVVAGSKRHPESAIEYPLGRKIISRIYYIILWILFDLPLNDTQTGLKIFRRKPLSETLPYLLCKRYALDVELLANIHHRGYKISEAPVILKFRRPRHFGRIGLRDLYHTGLDTLAIFYRLRLIRYYDRAARNPELIPVDEEVLSVSVTPTSLPQRQRVAARG